MKLSMRYIGLTIIALLGLQGSLTARVAAKSEAARRLSVIERNAQAVKEGFNVVARCIQTGCERNALTKVFNQSIAAAENSIKRISNLLGMGSQGRSEMRDNMAAFLGTANTALISSLKSLEKRVKAVRSYADRVMTGSLSATEKAQLLWSLKVAVVAASAVTVVVTGALVAKGEMDRQAQLKAQAEMNQARAQAHQASQGNWTQGIKPTSDQRKKYIGTRRAGTEDTSTQINQGDSNPTIIQATQTPQRGWIKGTKPTSGQRMDYIATRVTGTEDTPPPLPYRDPIPGEPGYQESSRTRPLPEPPTQLQQELQAGRGQLRPTTTSYGKKDTDYTKYFPIPEGFQPKKTKVDPSLKFEQDWEEEE